MKLYAYLKTSRVKIVLFSILIIFNSRVNAQSVTNGFFTSGTSGWSCSPETNPESVYGGSGSNRVAEVDAAAGLCQTISGFTIGSLYQITFDCSRRTTCGPPTQRLDFSIDGGALAPQSVSRTGGFNLTQESFDFVATGTSHIIDFNGTTAGTCGLIIDNIVITLLSSLPVELVSFNAYPKNNEFVELSWQTASERNNDYFSIERSVDGIHWFNIMNIDGTGNSSELLIYKFLDKKPYRGVSYYRLNQTDFNGENSFSEIKSINLTLNVSSLLSIYPNPSDGLIIITGSNESELNEVRVFNALGVDVTAYVFQNKISPFKRTIDLSVLAKGTYFVRTKSAIHKVNKH